LKLKESALHLHALSFGMSRSEQFTAIVVGIGTYFFFDHFHLISSSYEAGRIAAQASVALGAAIPAQIHFGDWPDQTGATFFRQLGIFESHDEIDRAPLWRDRDE
jgi:hypothetical protein